MNSCPTERLQVALQHLFAAIGFWQQHHQPGPACFLLWQFWLEPALLQEVRRHSAAAVLRCALAAQRILSVDYQLPYNKQVSPECKHLLECILVADPEKRITMADIQRHPWFTRDLPEGVAHMNDQLLAQQQHMLAQYGQ